MNNSINMFADFIQIISDYIEKNNIQNKKDVLNYQTPENLKENIKFSVDKAGCSQKELLSLIEKYLKYSVNTGNPQFFNQLYAGFNFPAFMGEVITALTNTSMYTYEVAPVATVIEQEMVKKMLQLANFEHGDGIFVTGGSNANLVAMFSARNKVYPEIKNRGIYGLQPLSMFVSEEAHYSFENNANLLGLGTELVYKIKSDTQGRLIPKDLQKQIEKSIANGEKPFFVAGTAATTMLGAYDPFNEMADIAHKYNAWMHVDGSFGGSLILSDKQKYLFKGLEKADSFAWNPHKLMNIPLVCSVILVNEKNRLYQNLTNLHDDYIFHQTETGSCDLGKKSIQCGRRVDALKLWLAWKYYGDNGYALRMDNLVEMAKYFEQKVMEAQNLELVAKRQSVSVCFRYLPKEAENIDKLNLQIRENLRKAGKSIVNYGYINGNFTFRWVVANGEVCKKDIDKFFQNFNDAVNSLPFLN